MLVRGTNDKWKRGKDLWQINSAQLIVYFPRAHYSFATSGVVVQSTALLDLL